MVGTDSCHFCADASQALAQLAARIDIEVEHVDATGEAGRKLVGVHRPAMLPLVLLDGGFFSAGRLPRRKLEKALLGGAGR